MSDSQTNLFSKYGAFFAFSNKQFNEQKQDNVKYVSISAGLIAPKENVTQLITELNKLSKNDAEQDIADNGIKKIIHRELANYECQISGEYDCVVDLLAGHGITQKQIAAEWPEFYQQCIDNDYF